MTDYGSDPLLYDMERFFQTLPRQWDGRDCITAMREHDFQWRQMEWIGFYFELVCQLELGQYFKREKQYFLNTTFDGISLVPWDLKTHCLLNVKGREQHQIILNDVAATDRCVSEYGALGLAVLAGEPEFDNTGEFYEWHEKQKATKSRYQLSDPGRRSRVRKAAFNVKHLSLYLIDHDVKESLKRHSQGKNSDGRPRPSKYMLDTKKTRPFRVFSG